MKTRKKERCRAETFTVSVRHLFHKSAKVRKWPLPSPNGRSRLRDRVGARTRPGII